MPYDEQGKKIKNPTAQDWAGYHRKKRAKSVEMKPLHVRGRSMSDRDFRTRARLYRRSRGY